MSWQRKLNGGILATVGFILSPLTWWNDLFVNIPLALAFAWMVSYFYRPAFTASLIIGYWLTNVLGFVLMHKGAQQIAGKEKQSYTCRSFGRDLFVSLLYTGFIVVLVELHLFAPLPDYFSRK